MSPKKERKLTQAEQRRLDAFNATCDELASQGYKRTDLNVGIFGASAAGVILFIVLLIVLVPLFSMLHPEASFALSLTEIVIYLVVFVALVVVHELIHGLTWSFSAPHGFKDIEFGIMLNSLSPYCTCRTPLRKGAYITGALMPLIVLGIIPTLIALAIGSIGMLYMGLLMIVAAMGDILIVIKVLHYKPISNDVLLFDHPTEAGSVAFER